MDVVWLRVLDLCTNKRDVLSLFLTFKDVWMFFRQHPNSYKKLKERWLIKEEYKTESNHGFKTFIVDDFKYPTKKQLHGEQYDVEKRLSSVVVSKTRFTLGKRHGVTYCERADGECGNKIFVRYKYNQIISEFSISDTTVYKFYDYQNNIITYESWYDHKKKLVYQKGMVDLPTKTRFGLWEKYYPNGQLKKRGEYNMHQNGEIAYNAACVKRCDNYKTSLDIKSGVWDYYTVDGKKHTSVSHVVL